MVFSNIMNIKENEIAGGNCKISINEKWCKRCGICAAFCPAHVFETDDFGVPEAVDAKRCIKCMNCVVLCPDFAVEVVCS